jgi:hypothetical protein
VTRAAKTRTSVSVATVEFAHHRDGTRLVYTEQGAFIDGRDDPRQREKGSRQLLDGLGHHLRGPLA